MTVIFNAAHAYISPDYNVLNAVFLKQLCSSSSKSYARLIKALEMDRYRERVSQFQFQFSIIFPQNKNMNKTDIQLYTREITFCTNLTVTQASKVTREGLKQKTGYFCEYRSTDSVNLRKTKEIKDRKRNNSK